MARDAPRGKRRPNWPGRPLESSALLAHLPEVSVWPFEVQNTTALTPSMRRLRLRAPGLATLQYHPGQDLMVAVPAERGQVFRRRYTIRSLDRSAGVIDIDVVLHGDGPGARWAANAKPGDQVKAIGPRGKITLVPGVDWHLFAGDESALPGTFAMIEALPAGSKALALLEIDGPADEQTPVLPPGCPVRLHWVHRGDVAPGASALLVDALKTMALPAGLGHGYLAGELRAVAAMRAVLEAKGMASDQLSTKPYWRLGVSNAAQRDAKQDRARRST